MFQKETSLDTKTVGRSYDSFRCGRARTRLLSSFLALLALESHDVHDHEVHDGMITYRPEDYLLKFLFKQ